MIDSISEPTHISDTRITSSDSVSFYSQHAILKVRVPLLSQYIHPSRELRQEIIWRLEIDYSAAIVNALLRYVYNDELDKRLSIDDMLELLSVACIYWIPRLIYIICNYLFASLNPLNVIQIANYVSQRTEHGLMHRNLFRTNVDNFKNRRDEVSAEILKYNAQSADFNAIGILIQKCVHYIILFKNEIEIVRDLQTLAEPVIKLVSGYSPKEVLPSIPEIKSVKSDLTQSMKWLYKDAEFKDFVVSVDNSEIRCHKSVLSSGSEYFKYLFRSNFTEVEQGKVIIMEHSYEVVNAIIMYIYLGSQCIHQLESELLLELLQASEFYRLTSSNMK